MTTQREEDASNAFAMSGKAAATVEHAVRNLRSLAREVDPADRVDHEQRPREMVHGPMPHLDKASAPAVLICGAGPTLDLDRVKAAHDAGVSIWTVNTAARAVCSVVRPDVVVIRESLDVSGHLDGLTHYPGLVVMDLCAHPNVWAAALARGPAAFFVAGSLQTFGIAAALDVAPVYGGSASLTAAVAIAAAGGVEWIGLEGVDLAYARDGAGYAPGARYQAALGADGIIAGGAEQRDLALASGQRPPPTRPHCHAVHARDGGEHLQAQGPWLDQIVWLENFAARRPYSEPSACRDRGMGLADLVGWIGDGEPCASGPFTISTRALPPERVDAVHAELDRQIDCQIRIAAAVTSGTDPTTIYDLIDGACIPDTHAAGAVMRSEIETKGRPFAEILRARYAAFTASAEALRKP